MNRTCHAPTRGPSCAPHYMFAPGVIDCSPAGTHRRHLARRWAVRVVVLLAATAFVLWRAGVL
jgi:hypothetical protein